MGKKLFVAVGECFLTGIDFICERVAKFAMVLVVPLIGVEVYEVIARYGFNAPTIWAFEMSRFFGGSLFVLGLAWALIIKAHIRVDILYKRLPTRHQAILDIVFTLLLVFPVLIFSLDRMIDWTWEAWKIHEVSSDSAWRVPIYQFKTVMPISFFLLLLAVVATFIRDLRTAVGR